MMENITDHEKECFRLQTLRLSVLCDIKTDSSAGLYSETNKKNYFQESGNFQTADS